jgi:hypothetical protein
MISVVELRQYTLRPRQRAVLIELFEREFVESQESLGIRLVGQFRDLTDPDRFVWLRGFTDMESRAEALGAFYGGPMWRTHRGVANATMIDSGNVLLLRPAAAGSGFPDRVPTRRTTRPASRVLVTTYHPAGPMEEFKRFFADRVAPVLASTGGKPVATFETEPAENTFPALPVRTGEKAFVWFSRFATAAVHGKHQARLAESIGDAGPELLALLKNPPDQRLLAPTTRSLLR